MKTIRITVDAEYDEDDFDDDEQIRRAINRQLALRGIDAKFVLIFSPGSVDGLWAAIKRSLTDCPDQAVRNSAIRVLQRRLAHPEYVGLSGHDVHLEPEERIHPKTGTGSPPRMMVLCQCGDPRHNHDEDGACERCHCPRFVSGS